MKIKFTINELIVSILFCLFFLIDSKFLYLISLPQMFQGEAQNKLLLALFSLIVFIVYFIFKRGNIKIREYGSWIMSLLFIVSSSGISALMYFQYPLRQVLWPISHFGILLLYFPFRDILRNKVYLERFIKIGQFLLSILSILFLIQVLVYKGIPSLFLRIDDMILPKYIYSFESLRIYSVFEGTVRIFTVLVAYKIIKKEFKNSFFDIISFLLLISSIFFVDQSRYYFLTIIFSIIFMFFKNNGIKITLKQLLITGFLFLITIFLFHNSFYSIYESIVENTGSSYARTGAMDYYFNKVILFKPLLGLSLSIPIEGTSIFYFIKGPAGIFNYSDIGVIGVFASLGLTGFIWYISISINFIKKLKSSNEFVMAIIINFLLSVPIMAFIDKPRLTSLMLLLVFIDVFSLDKIYDTNIFRIEE